MHQVETRTVPLIKKQRVRQPGVQDTTVGIWEHLFRVSVTSHGLRGVSGLRQSGVLLSGHQEIDKDAGNREVVTYMCINDMLELFRVGTPIKVCNVADTKKIYDNISAHLQMWKYQLEKGVNLGNAPIEDLMLLDRFANTVYAHAKYQFRGDVLDNIVAKHFAQMGRVGTHNFFNPGALFKVSGANVQTTPDGVTMINGDPVDKPPERESFNDFFQERMVGLMNRRGS
jgi:hypothetical protein